MDEKSPLCGMTFVSKVHTHTPHYARILKTNLSIQSLWCTTLPVMQWCLTSCQERAAEQHATYLCNAELGAHSSIGVCVCRTLVVAFHALINMFDFFRLPSIWDW